MPDLSFAPLLAEHRLWWSALRVRWLCLCGWEHRGPGDVAADAHDAHLETVLLAEVARVLGCDEAEQVVYSALCRELPRVAPLAPATRAALAALTTRLTGDTHG